MDRDIALLLVGAGIALVTSVVTAILSHSLDMHADKVKRKRDAEEEQAKAQSLFLSKYGKEKYRGFTEEPEK